MAHILRKSSHWAPPYLRREQGPWSVADMLVSERLAHSRPEHKCAVELVPVKARIPVTKSHTFVRRKSYPAPSSPTSSMSPVAICAQQYGDGLRMRGCPCEGRMSEQLAGGLADWLNLKQLIETEGGVDPQI